MTMTGLQRDYKITNRCVGFVCLGLALLPVFLRAVAYFTPGADLHALLPRCQVLEATGRACPTCGLTRSVLALYGGDLDASLRFHFYGWAVVALLWAEVALRLAIDRSRATWMPWADLGHVVALVLALLIWLWMASAMGGTVAVLSHPCAPSRGIPDSLT